MAGGLCFARCQGSTGSTLPPPGSSAVYSPSSRRFISSKFNGFTSLYPWVYRRTAPSSALVTMRAYRPSQPVVILGAGWT